MHIGLAATLAEQGAVSVGAGVQVVDVVLVGFRTADRALPSGRRATTSQTFHRDLP
jgi:hypothetical protein